MAALRLRPADLKSTRFTRSFEKRVAGAIGEGPLLRSGDRVLVAVSGGPDSTALLIALAGLRERLGVKLAAAHFDHRLRSREEAEGDAAFVRALADALGVTVEFGAGDVKARARRRKESIEEAARAMRYAFLKRTAKKLTCNVVAVAHNREDQAETVLMRIIRGAGLDGISGMRPRARWPFGKGPDVARPLLDVPRSDIERYCADLGLEPRRDPTNDLPVATRNRVRNELLPLLREFNPRIEESLARLADSVALEVDHLNHLARMIFDRARFAVRRPGSVQYVRWLFDMAPPGDRLRYLKLAYEHLTGSAPRLEVAHVRPLLGDLGSRKKLHSLPGGLTASVTRDWVTISSEGEPVPPRLESTRLRVPGVTRITGWTFEAEITAPPSKPATGARDEAYLDAEAITRPLRVRSRRPGDRLRPLGLGGSKKVQDILVDAKVPEEERDAVPILYDAKGIVWVVGHCIDERAAVSYSTRRVIHLRARRV